MSTEAIPPAPGHKTTATNELVVRAVLDRVFAAWAANDADAFVEPYAEHATAQLPGSYLADRQAIHTTMSAVFAGDLKGSRGLHDARSVRFLSEEVAIVISRGAVLFPGQSEPDVATKSLDTWVLSKHSGSWQVEAFHSCPATAAA